MSKIQDVPFITKVIDTLSDELKSGLYDLIDGQVKTPVFRSLVNNDYAITEANDKGKVQFVTLETLRGNYTGYLAYNSVYCVLIAFKGNTQALDMLNINVAKHTFAFVNESLSILELRVELEDGKKGVTPTDLGVTNNNIHLAKGTTQIGKGVNLKTLDGNTLIGSGNVGFKTINDQGIVGDGNIVVGEGGTIAIDSAFDETSTNAVQNKVIAKFANEVVENKANVDGNYPTMTVGNADNANNLIATKGLEVESYFTFGKTGGEQASAIESGNGTLKNLYGKTEKSENLLVYSDLSGSVDGVTYSSTNGILKMSGTWTGNISSPIFPLLKEIYLNAGTYTLSAFNPVAADSTQDVRLRITDLNFTVIAEVSLNSPNANFNFTLLEAQSVKIYVRMGMFSSTNDFVYSPMLVKGSTVPTAWSQGYDGLKHTHINGLKSTQINIYNPNEEYQQVNPNVAYYVKGTATIAEYDINKNLITSQSVTDTTFTTSSLSHFIKVITTDSELCINFSNPNINGNYYPYEEETLDIEFEGNGVGTAHDELDVEEKKKYQRFGIVDLGTLDWQYDSDKIWFYTPALATLAKAPKDNSTPANILCSNYETTTRTLIGSANKSIALNGTGHLIIKDTDAGTDVTAFKTAMSGVYLVYELAEPIVTDVEIPKDTIKVWNGGSMEALGTEIPVGTKIFYQKNIKAFVEAFGESIDWNPERIERLAKLSITPEYVNISLNPSQANAYAVAQVYNATFTIVISTALTGTADSSITFQDSEIDLSSFETQPAESIYDMDGKKVSEEPTTEDCNIASFVGRSYNGIVLWSLLHSGVNKVKVHFEQAIPLDSEGNGKLDCRASLIL